MRDPGETRPFRGPTGEVVSGSIAEVAYLRLGGLDQWVMIRGESITNPPLMLLHGGPGFSETRFFRLFNAPLEKIFTVVYWDQRGTGKSCDHHISQSSMTVERFIADLDELVEAVCKRVGKKKVALLGLCSRRALRRAVPREGRGLRLKQTSRRLVGSRPRREVVEQKSQDTAAFQDVEDDT